MAWPPTPLPNNRDNSTPQIDNHPSDHNDIANTLAVDFVGQINDNIGDISTNAAGIVANAAASIAGDDAIRVNFLPAATPTIRGDGLLFTKANGDPIGSGRLQSLVNVFAGMDVGSQVIQNTDDIVSGCVVETVTVGSDDTPFWSYVIHAVFDIEAGGDATSLVTGSIFHNGSLIPGSRTAQFKSVSPGTGRATVSTIAAVQSTAGPDEFDLRIRQVGSLATIHAAGTTLFVQGIYP